MNINNAVKIKGRFKLVVDNVETGEHQELGWQDNVVLNQILSSTVDKKSGVTYCLFGTGATAPTVNDTSLAAPLATNYYIRTQGSTGSSVTKTRVGEVHTRTITYKLVGTQGQVQGNVTELALASSTTQATICTRALIKNELGNPVTLTLGINDILTVYYAIDVITDCSVNILATKTFMFNGQEITATLQLINQDTAPAYTDATALMNYSWLSTGESIGSVDNTLLNLFLGSVHYMTIASGAISNKRAVTIAEVSKVHDRSWSPQTTNVNGQGIKLATVNAPAKEFLAGTATGTWKYIFFNGYPTKPTDAQTEMSRCNFMIEFNPPLVKAAADKFVFDTMELISGGVPL